MSDHIHRPVLIIIAGPNGSGKTTITSRILHHEPAASDLQSDAI